MDARFVKMVETLRPSFARLVSMPPVERDQLRSVPMQGVYLFSEGDQHLYIGRSNNLRQRYRQHSTPGSQHNQAVFAFKLARVATGRIKPAYVSGNDSRKGLLENAEFMEAFKQAKRRVRRMDYRFVEEADQTRQALLEIYCAVVLGCLYNDFDTH